MVELSTLSGRKEVTFLNLITSFILAIGANIVSHYICKWLDNKK